MPRSSRRAVVTRPPIPSEIWVLVASAFVIAIGYGLISPVLPAYARSFDVGVAAASVVVSAFAHSYWQLLLYRGLGGLGSTMFTVSAMALLVRLAPPEIRGRVSSAYASAFLIGGMIGPVLGGLLAEIGLRVPFVVYAIALVLAAMVVGVKLSGTRLRPAPGSAPAPPMTMAGAWQHRTYRAAVASGFANGWSNFGVRVAILPQFAVAVYDATWVAGVVLALGAVGTALALQIAGRLTDDVGRRPLVIIGMAVSAVGLGVMGFATNLVALIVIAAVSGFGAGLLNPAQQAAMADVVGNDRSGGKVLAVFQMAQDSGAIIGPIAIGVVADIAGYPAAFVLTGVVASLAIWPWVAAPETSPKQTAAAAT